MGLIKQLKQFITGVQIFPVTKTNAVYDDSVGRLDIFMHDLLTASDVLDGETDDIPRDADTLGGYTPDHYAKQSDLDELNIDINTLGESGVKNMLAYPYSDKSKTIDGITFTDNGDGTVSVNGTNTGSSLVQFYFQTDKQLALEIGKDYILSGCPSGGSTNTYRMRAIINYSANGTVQHSDIGKGVKFTVPDNYLHIRVMIDIYPGVTIPNLMFKPMIRHASIVDSKYERYTMTNKEITNTIGEMKDSFQDGCDTIVSGITAKGVTPASNSPADIVTAIDTLSNNKYNDGVNATKVGNATVSQVLTGKTFTNASGVGLTGTMADNGAVAGTITTSGGTYTVPAGYHNGSGKVTGPTLASLIGTNVTLASAANLLTGNTAYGKNGTKYTGSMANNGAVAGTISTSGGTYTVPVGYHNGSGKVTGPTLAALVGTNVTLASAANLLTGNTAYGKNGTKYTGSMANKGAWTNMPTSSGKVTIPAGYHNGSGYVDTSSVYKAGLSALNIVKFNNGVKVTINKKPSYIFVPAIWQLGDEGYHVLYYINVGDSTCRYINELNNEDKVVTLSNNPDFTLNIYNDGFTLTNNLSTTTISHILYN